MKSIKIPPKVEKLIKSRWFIFTTAALVTLLAIGIYFWNSTITWNSYQQRYETLQSEVNQQLTAAFSLQSDTSTERTEKLTQLANLNEKLAGAYTMCQPHNLVRWQTAFSRVKKLEERCQRVQLALVAFRSELVDVTDYLAYEKQLSAHLTAVPLKAEISEADFENELNIWRSLLEAVKSTSSNEAFEPVKQQAVQVLEQIVSAWQEVIAAHQAKDKARYTKATAGLAAAHDQLGAISLTSLAQLTDLANALKDVYNVTTATL